MITEEGFVDFKCPYCGHLVSFPQASVESLQECVNCLESLIVPKAGSEVGHRIPIPIATPRLVLRRLSAADWKDLMELDSTGNSAERTERDTAEDEKEVHEWLARDQQVKLTSPDQWFHLGIEVQSTARVIGHVSLWFPDHERWEVWISILINRHGCEDDLAVEAIAGLLNFCFEDLKLHRVVASRDQMDVSTIRWFEQAGLRREGEFLKDRKVNGEWHSTVRFAILEAEYHEKRTAAPPKGS